MLTIALAGNPNCGKTSLFNLLTKSRQHKCGKKQVLSSRKLE
ncbi:hypothetical protein CYK87_02450 [Clostridium perfringens]|nr:hypothetical protein CYK87_02450 [Clostridium perfringens]